MSKIFIIPDSHLKIDVIEHGVKLAEKLRADKIILLGDYFDDWCAIPEDYRKMEVYLKNLLRSNPSVVPLLGNHEYSYIYKPCSGYNRNVAAELRDWLAKDFRFLNATTFDGVMYSHAGFTHSWLVESGAISATEQRFRLTKNGGAALILDAVEKKVSDAAINWVGKERGGNDPVPGPMWADLTELINDPIPKIKQVVGHTPVSQIECLGNIWFTDVYSNNNVSDEYLFVVDGEPQVVHYEEMMNE